VIFPRPFIYSILAMSLMVFRTIACSFFGKVVCAVVSANDLGVLVFNWDKDCVYLWVSATVKVAGAILSVNCAVQSNSGLIS